MRSDVSGSQEGPWGFPVSAAVTGMRVGAFVVLTDDEGLRHAVRLGSVLALSDADSCQDTAIMQMPGGRTVLIRAPLEEVLRWFT